MNAPFTSQDPTPRFAASRNEYASVNPSGFAFDARLRARVSIAMSFLVTSLFALSAAHSSAQEADDPFAGIEEMVVVGSGTASLLQSKEVSAIAFSADHLEAIGANDLTDVATFTPNLEIRTPFAASSPTLFIRGVGLRDFNANSSSSVAVYNDEIYMNAPAGQLAQLFDTENIEVLRGPQTTMYARNASAGTIRVIARKPTGTPGMTGSVTYGRFNQLDFDAAFENVIIPDRISVRTSAKWSQRDGFTKNRCADNDYLVRPPQRLNNGNNPLQAQRFKVFQECFSTTNTDASLSPPLNGWSQTGGVAQKPPVKSWVNDTKNWAARTIIRFQHDFLDMDWMLNIHGGQNRGDARQFQHIPVRQLPTDETPVSSQSDSEGYIDADTRLWRNRNRFISPTTPGKGDPFEGDYNKVEKEKIDLFGSNLVGKMSFDDGAYTLTTITGYEFNERNSEIDLDASPATGLEPRLSNSSYQLTEELRLDFDDGGAFKWQLAGMFMYEGLEVDNAFAVNVNVGESNQKYTFFTRYAAAWTKFEWEPAETFSLKGGVRLNYEEKELNLTSQQFRITFGTGALNPRVCPLSCPVPGLNPGDVLPPSVADSHAKAFGWAGDLIATWSPATDVAIYLRYARGWKGPHINGGIATPGAEDSDTGGLATPVDPEIIDSLEIGMKAEFWANRIRWNWALFYYDYQDIQVFQLKNSGGSVPVQELINADDADVLGVEMEFDMKPFEGWAPPIFEGINVRLTFSWLDTKYTDFVNTFSVFAGDPPVEQLVTEDFTGNQLVNAPEISFIGYIMWPVGGDWGVVIPRLDWSYKDKVYFGASNAELAKQNELWLMNMRVTYKSPSDTFELHGWIENLTDQVYTVDAFSLGRVRGAVLHAVGDPRTYGLTIKVNF